MRIAATRSLIKRLEKKFEQGRIQGDQRIVDRARTILAVVQGVSFSEVASVLKISTETVRTWVRDFILKGMGLFDFQKSPGRPPKLTKSQKQRLKDIVADGPQAVGYPGGCWRTPMIQDFIQKTFKVFYSVHYLSELLKNLGLTFQKAKFVSDHFDEQKRVDWIQQKWPEIIRVSQKKNAHILFGDEASFPQWGSLSYTWAPRGKQPVIKTSGSRKGYKVFGLIEYWSGAFFHKAIEAKFTSASYSDFLKDVLTKTRKHLILIQDGARYHTSKDMQVFFNEHKERITVFQMPSYSPDYNPIEKLWKKIKGKGTHLTYFENFDALKNKVNEMLGIFEKATHEVLALFGFYDELAIGAR